MKIIFSRKGFDSANGGVPSPIFPDGSMYSLPIAQKGARNAYSEIVKGSVRAGTRMGDVIADLTRNRVPREDGAHLDPDLSFASLPRLPGWQPAFGQTGAAQTHLARCNVAPGDVFVFFGWFRRVVRDRGGRWSFDRAARDLHVVFGWLQIGEVCRVDRVGAEGLKAACPWLRDHPHLHFEPDPRNTIYIGGERLWLPGLGDAGLPGAGEVRTFADGLVLTAPSASRRSRWLLPAWIAPAVEKPPLTYHAAASRWRPVGDGVLLDVVGRGQEFVLDCKNRPEASAWLAATLANYTCDRR